MDERAERYRNSSVRIARFFRGARRQAEAWAAGDEAPEIAAGNPDVARYYGLRAVRISDSEMVLLADVVAGILEEELG